MVLVPSMVFGVGHQPVAYMNTARDRRHVMLYVIATTSSFGLIAEPSTEKCG